jgi:DNA-binding CsgD family transcriptional regulator
VRDRSFNIHGNVPPELCSTSKAKAGSKFAAFRRCLTAMPQIQPVLTEAIGLQVRQVVGVEDLDSLRWSRETLLLGVPSLGRLQDLISSGNAGLMRGIHTLGIFMPVEVTRVREFITLLDGWLVWSGSAEDLRTKLELGASGYAIVAPGMGFGTSADQHRLELLANLTEAHLSLLPLLVEGMTDEEIAGRTDASLPTTKLLVRQLLARLQCRNRTEAAIFAWRHANVLSEYRATIRTTALQSDGLLSYGAAAAGIGKATGAGQPQSGFSSEDSHFQAPAESVTFET